MNNITDTSGGSEGEARPKFRNDGGVKEIRIGTKEFECIGSTPPHDHPHVYLEMGILTSIRCLYCGTTFCLDPHLQSLEAIPPECLFLGLTLR
jgi:uncharacterized Zn-finger protein